MVNPDRRLTEPAVLSAAMWVGVAAGAAAVLLLVLAVSQNGSQGLFQLVRPSAQTARLLLERAQGLRAEMWVDNIFLCLYAGFFLLLAPCLEELHRRAGNQSACIAMLARTAAAGMVTTAALDAAENAHILSMLAQAEQGLPLSQAAINFQAAASQVKFLVSCFALFVLSFVIPVHGTAAERLLVGSLRFLQLPLCVAIFVVQGPWLAPLYLTRAASFVVGFFLMAHLLRAGAQAESTRSG
jgi:hypothetical protein